MARTFGHYCEGANEEQEDWMVANPGYDLGNSKSLLLGGADLDAHGTGGEHDGIRQASDRHPPGIQQALAVACVGHVSGMWQKLLFPDRARHVRLMQSSTSEDPSMAMIAHVLCLWEQDMCAAPALRYSGEIIQLRFPGQVLAPVTDRQFRDILKAGTIHALEKHNRKFSDKPDPMFTSLLDNDELLDRCEISSRRVKQAMMQSAMNSEPLSSENNSAETLDDVEVAEDSGDQTTEKTVGKRVRKPTTYEI
ncbi:hypothetical protein C8J57DRAFT_1257707 [Mycena rebaudengoi]|nr:hypothetical protein C8J57DRAFT_1257707 [Mycena rebaudengoi]